MTSNTKNTKNAPSEPSKAITAKAIVALINKGHTSGVALTVALKPLVMASNTNTTDDLNEADKTLLETYSLCAAPESEAVRKRQKEAFAKACKSICKAGELETVISFKVVSGSKGKTFTLAWKAKPAKSEKSAAREAFDKSVKAFIVLPNKANKVLLDTASIDLALEAAAVAKKAREAAEANEADFILA